MSKLAKSKKIAKNNLKGPIKGRIQKRSNGVEKKLKVKDKNVKAKKNKKSKRSHEEDEDAKYLIKKKPSKAELKSVIEELRKDPGLIIVRKTLKYIPFYLKSEGLVKKLLKEIIKLWAEAGEKVRVVCLLCLIRIYTKLKDTERKQDVIKKLYNSFLDKCRITKQETMSMIGFMRHSLIELYKIDPNIAFKQAQTACQQLTLTLKSANTHKNEETYKTVLNWQFANCLILLSQLIASQEDDSPVKSLTHQVIQLNLGAINFLTSPRYYPYYCHLIENLISLSIATNLFIPVLPLMLNILSRIQIPIEKKAKKTNGNHKVDKQSSKKGKSKSRKSNHDQDSDDEEQDEEETDDDVDDDDDEDGDDKSGKEIKEYNMEVLNHVSLDEAHCIEYSTAVLGKIYQLMLRYLASQCHRIAFPELVLLPCIQLKQWLKKNPGEPAQKFKVLLEKIKSDCQKLEEERKSVDFVFTNYTAVDAWEKKLRDSNKMSLVKLSDKDC